MSMAIQSPSSTVAQTSLAARTNKLQVIIIDRGVAEDLCIYYLRSLAKTKNVLILKLTRASEMR